MTSPDAPNQSAAQSATVAMVRAMVAMGLSDGPIGVEERATVKRVYKMAAGADLEDEIIDLIARDITANRKPPRDVMAESGDGLDDVKKRRVIQSAYFVMTSGGSITDEKVSCLLSLADGLKMGKPDLDAAIAELEEIVGARDHADETGADAPSSDAVHAPVQTEDPSEPFLDAVFRAMVGVAVSDGPITPEERRTIRLFFDQIDRPVDDPTIDGFVAALEGTGASVGQILKRDAQGVEPGMKSRILQAACLVTLTSEEVNDRQYACLADIAEGLGLTSAELDDAIASAHLPASET